MRVFIPALIGLLGLNAIAGGQGHNHVEEHSAQPSAEQSEHGSHASPVEQGVTASISPAQGLRPGQKAQLIVELKTKAGKPVTPADLTVAHTEKVHILIIDRSLSDYHHVHPKPGEKPGTYTFSIVPRNAGEYVAFVDLLPMETARQEYIAARFTVEGTPQAVEKTLSRGTTIKGYRFDLNFEEEPLQAGQPHLAKVTVTGPDGQPFTQLEPVMGAFAHVVGFSEDRAEIAHLHPLGAEPESDADRGGPELHFHAQFPKGGFKKLFVQVRINGQDVYVPFAIEVMEPHHSGSHETSAHSHAH